MFPLLIIFPRVPLLARYSLHFPCSLFSQGFHPRVRLLRHRNADVSAEHPSTYVLLHSCRWFTNACAYYGIAMLAAELNMPTNSDLPQPPPPPMSYLQPPPLTSFPPPKMGYLSFLEPSLSAPSSPLSPPLSSPYSAVKLIDSFSSSPSSVTSNHIPTQEPRRPFHLPPSSQPLLISSNDAGPQHDALSSDLRLASGTGPDQSQRSGAIPRRLRASSSSSAQQGGRGGGGLQQAKQQQQQQQQQQQMKMRGYAQDRLSLEQKRQHTLHQQLLEAPPSNVCVGPGGALFLPSSTYEEVILAALAEIPSVLMCLLAVSGVKLHACQCWSALFLHAPDRRILQKRSNVPADGEWSELHACQCWSALFLHAPDRRILQKRSDVPADSEWRELHVCQCWSARFLHAQDRLTLQKRSDVPAGGEWRVGQSLAYCLMSLAGLSGYCRASTTADRLLCTWFWSNSCVYLHRI